MDLENVYSKEEIVNALKRENILNVHVFLAVKNKYSEFFYCKKYREVYEKDGEWDSCGKTCGFYTPKNGKSGCCKYRQKADTYTEGTEYILHVDGTIEEIKR